MHILHAFILFGTLAAAQLLIESASFGHSDRISQNGYSVQGWRMTGEGQVPEILTDKIVLTPGYTGNLRGALWMEARVPEEQWVAQLEFRATGPERGGGNLQIWYVKEGQWAVGSSSIYTVGKFDGFAVVVDPYGGQGGGIRGFMNDGNLDYKNYHSVDSLAFGHCEFSYRNLGRPSTLQIKQSNKMFEVMIDNKLCFSTDKVQMPKDYHFGITAASADTPDSFEVNKFLLFTDPSAPKAEAAQQAPIGSQENTPRDAQASLYKSSDAQFEDLHNRLLSLATTVDNIASEVAKLADSSSNRHSEVIRTVSSGDKLASLDQKLSGIENTLRGFESRFAYLQTSLRDSHSNLADSLPRHMTDVLTTNGPRMGLLIFVFVIVQIVLIGAYQAYKRRIKQGPKKYL